jgi:tetratricopeptide (TPR) repeat protein
VVAFPARVLAHRRAQQLLLEGRRHVVGLDPERAEISLRQALEAARSSGSVSLQSAAGEELYQLLLRRKRLDEAIPILRDMLGWQRHQHGRAAQSTAAWRNELTIRLAQLGRYVEAEPLCRDRLEAARKQRPVESRAVGFALVTLAWCVRSLGRWAEAEELCREAIAVLDGGRAPRGSRGWALCGLAAVLLRRIELDAAEDALNRAAQEWAMVGRTDLVGGVEELLMDLYVVGERNAEALAVSEGALNRTRRGAAAVSDRERQLRNLDRHAFLLRVEGRASEAARYELRAGYLREAVESQPRPGDGASIDPSGPVFEGEPVLDWSLPGIAVASRAC